MTITSSNLQAHELICLRVSISDSSDPTQIGVEGIVRDETRNTFLIQVAERSLRVPKKGSTFKFELPNGEEVSLSGSTLQFRPEDRIKRRQGQW